MNLPSASLNIIRKVTVKSPRGVWTVKVIRQLLRIGESAAWASGAPSATATRSAVRDRGIGLSFRLAEAVRVTIRLADSAYNLFDIRGRAQQNGVMQYDAAVMGPFGFSQRAGGTVSTSPPANVDGAEALVECHAFRPQRRDEAHTPQAERIGIELEADLVVSGRAIWRAILEQVQPGNRL